MSVRRVSLLVLALAALAAIAAAPASALSTPAGIQAKGKKKAKGKKCGKGFVPKTVTKHGKKTKTCKRKGGKGKTHGGGDTGGNPTPSAGLFEAPGKQLNGEEAKPFLQKYLANSTFTDCVTGWPSCGGFENRYSHSSSGTFYQCWLRPTSGSDVKSVGEYGFKDARVEPDGSWYYKELVYWYEHFNLFEWHVTAAGVVTGANLSDSGGAPEQIGPLQYVGGIAKDCSY
ncbi:MAG TPA: hypothetical protein VG518_09745 [Solirubrobacterales bacterium]|nr:hypothetical protein [Solirubrobacterales bacterium]